MKKVENPIEIKSEARIVAWPSPQDYNESIQNPAFCFSNSPLAKTEPELNVIGLPKPASGNFASVYRLYSENGEWAVRCFLQPMSDQQERYAALSAKLAELNFPFLVGFEFLPEGIRVHSSWYPIIKMEWVNGDSLLEYIQKHLNKAEQLHKLADDFKNMILSLQAAGIAHGDLQHGNIIVESSGQLRLVDYDAFYVPELKGRQSNELGHRNYQHPRRNASHFDENIDSFSARLIWLSIKALAHNPGLWERLQAGDECLLFRRQDLAAPEYSKAFHLLEIQNETIRENARALRSSLRKDAGSSPALDQEFAQEADLPPLQSVVQVRDLDSSTKSKRHEQEKQGSKAKQSKIESILLSLSKKGTAPLIQTLLILLTVIASLNMASYILSTPGFQTVWAPSQRERAMEVANISQMLAAAESGGMDIDTQRKRALGIYDDNPNQARDLFFRGQDMRYRNQTGAESAFQGAITLSGRDGRLALTSEELAIAQQYIGQRKAARADEDFGTDDLEHAYQNYKRAGYDRQAAFARREFANSAVMDRQYTRAYPAYMECLEDPKTETYHYSQIVTYATRCAIEMLCSQLSDYKNSSNIKRIWDQITKLSNAEDLYNKLLAELNTKAQDCLDRKDLEDARILFDVQRELAARRSAQKQFEDLALRKLEYISRLSVENKRVERPVQPQTDENTEYARNARLPRPE